ncbi:HXXEE domain-containing protein [uncultured Cytophaga sp.]|uniref:HXXEE domain-containing protein n=1 Tax=uncultured Cytophaga sp. TaxID=160238 RepID=UPI002638F774|nr:HXXEE domain-containing protein [uncultured Cytophaga sp.]
MDVLRKHWYDLGGLLSISVLVFVYVNLNTLSSYQLLMWLSLTSLFFHQLEEYRIVGTFPGMINTAVFNSPIPDRYPLNTNTALYINMGVGWLCYLLAALLAKKAIWLGIATILISLGNIIAHTFLFNIKGKTYFNAGMITCWLFFAPCIYFFIKITYSENLITVTDYLIGIPLGIFLNIVGVLKMITWLADKNTPYAFEKRNLLLKDRDINRSI